jgi:hypothetical protein
MDVKCFGEKGPNQVVPRPSDVLVYKGVKQPVHGEVGQVLADDGMYGISQGLDATYISIGLVNYTCPLGCWASRLARLQPPQQPLQCPDSHLPT